MKEINMNEYQHKQHSNEQVENTIDKIFQLLLDDLKLNGKLKIGE